MNPSRKICLCLALSIVVELAAGRNAAGQASIPTTTPVVAYPQPVAPRTTGAVVPARYTGWSFPGSDENPVIESPLVIPAGEMTVEAAGQIIEDLSIMARIIEKHVLDNYNIRRFVYEDMFALGMPPSATGPQVLFPSAGRPKPLYIGGHGALFFIQVDFPLVAPPETAKAPPAEAEVDPVWSQTRQSLLEPRSTGALPGRNETASAPFNQGKVDSLRKSLVAVMKQAANIRALGPKESLTIVIQGFGPATRDPGRAPSAGNTALAIGATPAGRGVMTLRATKADLDLFAKGQLNQTQLEERVQVAIY